MKIIAASQVPRNPGYFHLAYSAAAFDTFGVGLMTIGTGVGFMAATFFLLTLFRRGSLLNSGFIFKLVFGTIFGLFGLISLGGWLLNSLLIRNLPEEGLFALGAVLLLMGILVFRVLSRHFSAPPTPDPEVSLGDMYRDGIGVPPNLDEAIAWYQSAAEAGDPSAQAALAALYREGRGVNRDLIQAYKWYLLSGFNGALKPLESSLSPDQLREARRQAEEWSTSPHRSPDLPPPSAPAETPETR
jgi:hypothetical protein